MHTLIPRAGHPALSLFLRAACAALALTGATLSAQSTGTLAGRVTDAATQLALSGTRVSVEGTGLETYTGPGGDYVLAGVPAGPQTVVFDYIGYGEESRETEVGTGVTRLDAVFAGEAVQLDKFVIEGSLVGSARALNQQRAADTLRHIVASDEIGNFPDQNAAESLQRIPGVSIYRDQGEGRFVLVRGINYTLGNVMLNGAKLASPETGERGIALDVLPADALAAIEVTKVPTPDMDGEGLGGQVNIRTKSAFDADGRAASFSAQGQYSALADDFSTKFNGSVSTVSADGRWGLIVSPTWQKRSFGSHNFEINDGWVTEIEDGDDNVRELPVFFLQDLAFREYEIERERYGTSGALEFKPDAGTHFYFRASYNRFIDTENRHVSIIPFVQGTEDDVDNLTALTADSATIEGVRRFGRRLRQREKDQELTAFMAGFEKRAGEWTVDGQVNRSRGYEEKPGETEVRFRRNTRDSAFRYTFSGVYDVALEQLAGASITDPASYNAFQELTKEVESGEETETGFVLNARRELATASPAFVKTGVGYREKDKETALEVSEFDAPGSLTFASLAGRVSDYPYGFDVPQIDPEKFRQAFYGNPGAFDESPVFEDSNYDDWRSSEKVLSAYVMAGTTLGRTNLLGGLRAERTKFSTTGKALDLDDETFTAITAARSYTNWLPGVFLRHDASRNLVYRASWSNSIVRPSFGDSAIRRSINDEDEEITDGNPNLETLESSNFDASVEYYLPSLGVLSAGVFYKDIRNFSYETEVGADPAFPDYEVTSYRNGSDGHIMGLELAWQQQLRHLPAPFDGLGVFANLILSDSEADYPTRAGEKIRFIGQSDRVGNLALTYEKAGFFARVALNFRTERLREDEAFGGDETEDLWVDDFAQLDFAARYRLNRNWELFAEVLNITDEPFRVYQRGGDVPNAKRLVQVEAYDWSANFGVRWKL